MTVSPVVDRNDLSVEIEPASCFLSSDFSSVFCGLPAGSSFIIQNHGDGFGYPNWVYALRAVAPPVCIGDLDGNCTTDVLDFGVFTSTFGTSLGNPSFNPAADYDDDDSITVFDFGIWAGDFGCSN